MQVAGMASGILGALIISFKTKTTVEVVADQATKVVDGSAEGDGYGSSK